MAWLLYLDESGHDRRQMPYEVRGGIAIEDRSIWPLTRAVRQLESHCFGGPLHEFGVELKGSTLLDRKRFGFATQGPRMVDSVRQANTRAFLTKSQQAQPISRDEFTAYGQACLGMANGIFQLLSDYRAVLFASTIPRNTPLATQPYDEYLRKDHVFLLERFFYFLEREHQSGILVFDGSEKTADRKFIRQVENYFSKSATGRQRTQWIVPTPLFVSSDLTAPIQMADLCIYCVNWAFRLPDQGMSEPVREEIRTEFGGWLHSLQFVGDGERDGTIFPTWGICYVPNATSSGRHRA